MADTQKDAADKAAAITEADTKVTAPEAYGDPSLKEYEVDGVTMQLDERDAEKFGEKAKLVGSNKAASKPANKGA